MEERYPPKRPGRPRVEVDYALVLRLRDRENLGWSRGAEVYRRRTGQWISKDTFKRRYREAKAMKSPLERVIEELEWKLKTRGTTEGRW
ncbi:hypothetical protein ES704_02338 [subsurface metagenome]|jgi:hypothetical protein|uniref:Uncharacterized protein n=1 Tax=marine sediment metagenome TaxID=412755 RepID=X1C1A0_9ZZZZ